MDKIKSILSDSFMAFVVVSFIMTLGIWVGYGTSPLVVLPGLVIYVFICIVGVLLARIVPVPFPAVGWVAIVGIILSVPGLFPWSASFVSYSDKVPFLATATPALAYAGIAVGKDWSKFKKIGWKGILVCFLVFSGTFIGSAAVAEIILRLTGAI
ncbi:MAG: hypothetical protein APF77_20660 [Clostridia bacterium BRH_c25]|nr:MAG: hypothetical protein APF77_20660 [Clostridia bacterium BRH_c25]